jgi:hypothetical protein
MYRFEVDPTLQLTWGSHGHNISRNRIYTATEMLLDTDEDDKFWKLVEDNTAKYKRRRMIDIENPPASIGGRLVRVCEHFQWS